MKSGVLVLPEVLPGDSVRLPLSAEIVKAHNVCAAGTDVRLRFGFVLREAAPWAEAGHEVAAEQFCLQKGALRDVFPAVKGKLTARADGDTLYIQGKGFSIAWDLAGGSLASLKYGSRQMLYPSEAFPVIPLMQLFRAPTDNDKSFGNWLAKDWKTHGLDAPRMETSPAEWKILPDGSVCITTATVNRYLSGSMTIATIYTIQADGSIGVDAVFTPQGELPELPRVGVALPLSSSLERFTWYGRGPWENYPDRTASSEVGLWSSASGAQYTHYPRPQDSGNLEEVSHLSLTDKHGRGIEVEAFGKTFSASALHYTVDDLYRAAHDCELNARPEVILSIDAAVLGLGNSSCGPGVLKRYAVSKGEHRLKFIIRRVF